MANAVLPLPLWLSAIPNARVNLSRGTNFVELLKIVSMCCHEFGSLLASVEALGKQKASDHTSDHLRHAALGITASHQL